MGQVLERAGVVIDFLLPIKQPGKLLTKCKLNVGTSREFIRFYKRFVLLPNQNGFYITRLKLKEITANSPIEGLEYQLYKSFGKGSPARVNILEILSVILIYGAFE